MRPLLIALFALAPACHEATTTAPESAVSSAEADVDRLRAVAILEEAAGDLDVGVRTRALHYLILTAPEPGGGAWGQRGVWDPNPWVQRAAIGALGERLDEPESRSLLAVLVRREGLDPYVRGAAGVRLARAGDTSTLPDLQAALAAGGETWQLAPLALAAAQMGDAAAEQTLAQALREGELPLDMPFFSDLGRSGLAGITGALGDALSVVEEEARVPVAVALLQLGSRKGDRVLEAALGSDEPGGGLDLVDLVADADGAADLLHKAARGPEGPVKVYARLALLLHDDAGDPAILEEAAGSEDPAVRAVAAHVTGLLAPRAPSERRWDRAVKRCLTSALADPADLVRLEGVQALASSGRRSEARALPVLFDSELPELRVEAAGAALLLTAP